MSVISIMASCCLELLFSLHVDSSWGFCSQVQILCLFLLEEHLTLPRELLRHLRVPLRVRLLLQAGSCVWISVIVPGPLTIFLLP